MVLNYTGNDQIYISVHLVASKLGSPICCLLPAIHAVSRRNSISNFSHTGKTAKFQTLKRKLDELTDMWSTSVNSTHSLKKVVTAIQNLCYFMMRIEEGFERRYFTTNLRCFSTSSAQNTDIFLSIIV